LSLRKLLWSDSNRIMNGLTGEVAV